MYTFYNYTKAAILQKGILLRFLYSRHTKITTVRDIVFGTGHCFWDSGYLCHFSTEMAEIWSPGTSFQDVWTHKFSALYLLYFRSYEIFSGGKSGTKIGLELK